MRVCFSRINIVCNELKSLLNRSRTSKFLSSANLALLDNEVHIPENSVYIYDGCSSKFKEKHELSIGRAPKCEFVDEHALISENEQVVDEKLEKIRIILRNRGSNLNSQTGKRIGLDEFNVASILNDVYEESLDAELAFCFFKWSESLLGSEHAMQSVCVMIRIFVLGNMNYRAMDLVMDLVNCNSDEAGWRRFLMEGFCETRNERWVLETICSMAVCCYVKKKMLNSALNLTYVMKSIDIFPSNAVCNSLLRALLGLEQFELAWDLLEEMWNWGIGFNASIVSLFVSKHCAEGNIELGWKWLMDMKHYGVKPDVVSYTIVVKALCKLSYLREATSVLFKLVHIGISVDSVLLSCVVDAYCKAGLSENAIILLRIFNIFPNIYVYNSFISKLCTDNNMEKASYVFHEMDEWGLLPDCFSYSTMIGGYCKAKEMNKALEYLGKMLKQGIKPSVTTFTIFIQSYFRLGDMEMAEHFFQKMKAEGLIPDLVVYNILMDGYGRMGYLHKAFQLLDVMRSAGVSPDIQTYNTLIHGFFLRGYANEAHHMFDELIKRGFSPDVVTFTEIIGDCSKKGNFEEAFLVWFYMSENKMKPDVVTCSALLNGYCKARRMEEAYTLFHEMLNVGLSPDLILYNTLIHGFCSVGNLDNACKLVHMMVEHGILPNVSTYRALILGFRKKRDQSPTERAAFKLQEILLKHEIQVSAHQFIVMLEQPDSLN
ncbi:Pentatricopeptide repeat [Dillenia turbinata]|uniref:Pentatricopeptide repeat n=1 Tax=Dillenia turbinata TaxID=194707 RepID=A0AAN8VDI9_9MAGN